MSKPNPNYNTLDKKVAFDTKNYGYQSTPYSINNIAGFLYTSPNNKAFVTQNGSNFIIVSWIPLADANQYKQTVDQILSTFKFTDKNSTGDGFCGGIAGIPCPSGYRCLLDGDYPDAGGKCQK